jgi:hypothetical protein
MSEDAGAAAAAGPDLNNADHNRRPPKEVRTTKRIQLFRRLPDDLFQADCRQLAKCHQEHWVDDGRRQAALRHGLTAETVIGALKDAEDYGAFEAAITADYDVQSA